MMITMLGRWRVDLHHAKPADLLLFETSNGAKLLPVWVAPAPTKVFSPSDEEILADVVAAFGREEGCRAQIYSYSQGNFCASLQIGSKSFEIRPSTLCVLVERGIIREIALNPRLTMSLIDVDSAMTSQLRQEHDSFRTDEDADYPLFDFRAWGAVVKEKQVQEEQLFDQLAKELDFDLGDFD